MRTEETDQATALDDVDAAQGPAAGSNRTGGARTRARPGERSPSSSAAWVVAAVAVLVALVALVAVVLLVQQQRATEATIADVEAAAGGFALALTTWDASDGMMDTRDELRAAGTDTFAGDVDQLFGGTDDLATLEELGARSSGEVQDVLVQRVDGDTAEALAVIVQRVTTEVTEGEEVSLRYARLGLRREGGAWRTDAVELVVDALQETAARTDLDAVADREGEG